MDLNIKTAQQRFESWAGVETSMVDGWQRWDRMWFLENRACSIQQFLDIADDQAIVYAYRTLLGRNPDPGGFESYRQRLQSGAIQRAHMFFELRSSPEGVAYSAVLIDLWPGFFKMMWTCQKLWRWLPTVARLRYRWKRRLRPFLRRSSHDHGRVLAGDRS